MTFQNDPIRWTESIAEAPDALRAPFTAARNEGPSDLQMKSLALKLAALSAGTAAAASATTAKAASTTAGGAGAGAASAGIGGMSMAKVAVSVALFGATVTGAVVWQQARTVKPGSQSAPTVQVAERAPAAPASPTAPSVVPPSARSAASRGTAPSASPSLAPSQPSVAQPAPVALRQAEPVAAPRPQEQALDSTASVAARGVSARKSASRSAVVSQPASSAPVAVQQPSSNKPALSEVELLRRARAALSAHPREAFEITQEHRALYPSGMFAQERDALAIEALMRTGDTNAARELAAQFVRAHPNSAHAHRFRETLGL